MSRAPIALLLLVGGIAIGVVFGLLLGSGAGPVMARGVTMTQGAAPPASGPAGALDRPVSEGARRIAEPELARPEAAARPVLSDAALNEITTLAAASLGDEDEPAELTAKMRAQMITGVVVDERGEPIAGATVRTQAGADSPRLSTQDSSGTGREWSGEEDLAETLQERARGVLKSRRGTRVATTDEAGFFTLLGLEPGRHTVRANAEGLSFSSERTFTGQSTTLRGKAVQGFTLEIVDADGEAVSSAVVQVKGGYRPSYYDWSPEQPTIRLTETSAQLRAFAGDVARYGNSEPFAEMASESRRVTLAIDGKGPHRFELEPTRSVLITVIDQTTDGPLVKPNVRYAEAKKIMEAGGRSKFLGNSAEINAREDGRYQIADLEAGDYLLGVGRGLSEPEVFREFTVASTPVREEIVLGPLSQERFLVVYVKNSRGTPLSGLRFKLYGTTGENSNSWTMESAERAPGEFWIGWDRSADYWGAPVSLSIENPGLGSAVRPVTRDQKRLDVTLADPCDLTVELVADPETSYEITVSPKASVNGEDARSISRVDPEVAKGGGLATFSGIQPGLAEITVRKKTEGGNRWNRGGGATLARQELTLMSGEMRTTLIVSELHTLTVYAPGEAERARFRVRPAPNQPDGSLAGYASANLNAELVAELSGLAAGRYHLTVDSSGAVPPIEVTVPSGVVTYERPETMGFRVRKRRTSSEIAPLEVGDVITAVNGKSVSIGSLNDRINLAVAEGKATLSLLRDEKAIEVVLEKRPDGARYDPMSTLE
ncbi:MAG: hypothetical protein ACJAZN_002724 [Planctomycetota bacterium]|jgi:hypothetical protein